VSESALPPCPCMVRQVSIPSRRCGKPSSPVNGVMMECTSGHRFAGTPEEHAQAELAANTGRPWSLLEMFSDVTLKK
jgi:hypothetical protein